MNNLGKPTISTWIHHGLFLWIFFMILSGQATFVLTILGGDIPVPFGAYLITVILPGILTALQLWRRRKTIHQTDVKPWFLWAIGAPLMFLLWSGGYFSIGFFTQPEEARLLSDSIDRLIPLSPPWVFLYILVYPLFILPFFFIRDRGLLYRTMFAHALALSLSFVMFLVFPVTFDRPILLDPPPDFSHWTLAIVYGNDPPWNCFPSTHCAVALISALSFFRANRSLGIWALITAALIGVSTLFTKQHYLIDAIAGFLLAGAIWRLTRPRRAP